MSISSCAFSINFYFYFKRIAQFQIKYLNVFERHVTNNEYSERLGKKSILDSIPRGSTKDTGLSEIVHILHLTRRSRLRTTAPRPLFSGSHVRPARLPRGGHVAGSAGGLLDRRGPRPGPDRESARAQSAPGSPDLRVSGLFVRGLRRDARAAPRAARQGAIRRGVLLLGHHVDPPEPRRQRPGGVPAAGLRARGHDRRRAAALEVLPERVATAATGEAGGVPAAAGAQVHRRPGRARRGHFAAAVRLSQGRRHRRQRMGTRAFDLRKEAGFVKEQIARDYARARIVIVHVPVHEIVSIASAPHAHRF